MKKQSKIQSREELKTDYRAYLSRQRGLAAETVYKYCTFVDRFLDFRFGESPDDLSKVTGHDVADFLQHQTGGIQPFRDKTLVSTLRSLFRFLFQSERIAVNLALGIPSIAQKHARRIPYHLTPDQVEELLKAVPTSSALSNAKRNYAMVLLMARLGLRSPEIIAMQLDDIDWRNGEICIRGKGGFHDKVPLLQDTGEAIANYIQHERKGTSRFLFVASRSPHRPFKDAQVLNTILTQALETTTIPRPKQYTVSHILRHSLATNLVQRGASLEEIANTLRHRSRQTTLLYARQDIDGLRTIALSWPLAKGGRS
ncbi:MAG: tyrosine-type recombinase/integrase [Algoriphagus sp.]|nr:tyrosine-type recombinase/integrase [Algoriphagus sp.]